MGLLGYSQEYLNKAVNTVFPVDKDKTTWVKNKAAIVIINAQAKSTDNETTKPFTEHLSPLGNSNYENDSLDAFLCSRKHTAFTLLP